MQCKDIPDAPILMFLTQLPLERHGTPTRHANWHRSDPVAVQNAMPSETPDKLALAKMGMLIRRGLVRGCTCGCRGDFEITDKGREMLNAPSRPAPATPSIPLTR